MFEFELLPHDMQLEILKKTEFRTVQKMKRVSKTVKGIIQRYRKYMMPMEIRQILITSEKVHFTLKNSCEVCVLQPEDAKMFLQSALVDLLWLEASHCDSEPIEYLTSVLPSNIHVGYLKLGSSRSQCDVRKLTKFMKVSKCRNLIIDWRFHLPSNFFEVFPIEILHGFTIGEEPARHRYNPIRGAQLQKFKGAWLELGPNALLASDFIKVIESWKSGELENITQYNIAINFRMEEILEKLRMVTRQESSTRWRTRRDDDRELEITYYPATNFVIHPSFVLRPLRT